jgi:hypothetical protein
MISSSCSNSDTRCVTIVTNSEIRHEGGTDRIVINGTSRISAIFVITKLCLKNINSDGKKVVYGVEYRRFLLS